MTLYWWMHWFWITTLQLQVLVSLFSWSLLVQAASLPFAPLVQNGHQNGPYFNEVPSKRGTSTLPSHLSTNSEQGVHYFIPDLTSIKQDDVQDITRSPTHVEPQILVSDLENTESPPDLVASSTEVHHEARPHVNVGKKGEIFQFKNSPVLTLETLTTSSSVQFSFPNTNDNDDTAHTLLENGPLFEESRQKENEDSKIIWVGKLSPKTVGVHDKHTKIEQLDEKVGKETLPDNVPMSDGPYNPMGSFINSTNIRVKTVLTTLKPPETSTKNDQSSTHSSTYGRIDEDMKDNPTINISTTDKTVLFVTPNTFSNPSDSTKNMDEDVEHVNGNLNLTSNSTESIFEDDDNSTLVMGDDSTYVAKTNENSSEIAQTNKSSPENAKNVAGFVHNGNMESTKGPSILVQSVIDESVNTKGKKLDAATITGIILGAILCSVLTVAGVVSCVVYHRRYLNNPQTLNDKCSNPDSSGYIDDSTLRENSEEMYSLDNDSFLNSLEAMTIQNYWTDNVKHTKL